MHSALVLVLAIIAAPAIATSSPPAATGTVRDPAADAQKIVCKGKPTTGTRFAKSKCMTKAQWDAIAEQQRREAEEWFNKPTINPPGD